MNHGQKGQKKPSGAEGFQLSYIELFIFHPGEAVYMDLQTFHQSKP